LSTAHNRPNGVGRSLCDCPECKINGKRYALHRPEDCEYARRRAALVPRAVAIANKRVPVIRVGDVQASLRWTREFAAAMDSLYYQLERKRCQKRAG